MLRYRVECTSVEQDSSGVTATLHDLDGGSEWAVRAKYVVAADGNRSPMREQLGIGMRGHGLLSNSITIYFRSEVDLSPLARVIEGVNYVTNPVLRGFFRLDRTGNRGFLVVNLVGDTARPEIIAAYPAAPWANVAETIDGQRALELLRAAIGVPEIPVVVEDIATWRAVADSAERYQHGRVCPGRRRRPHDAAERRLRRQHGRAGCVGPRLESRARPERRGRARAARHLRRRAARDRRADGRAGVLAVRDQGRALSRHRGHAGARRRLLPWRSGCRCNSAAVVLEPGEAERRAMDLCTSIRGSRRADRARARRTCSSTVAERRCRRSTCSVGGTCCWPGRRALPGTTRRPLRPAGAGCRPTRTWSVATKWPTLTGCSRMRTGSPRPAR